jgi:glycerophosphoryl diester phosphodiesterase
VNIAETNIPALKLLASAQPLVIGHRGYCQLAPENTLPSFKLALEAGADLVELDYRDSKDGQLVVIHDAHLDRTTDSRRRWRRRRIKIETRTAAELQTLEAGSWFALNYAGTKIPLLSEALDLIQKTCVTLIERKAGEPDACIRLLREKDLINRVIVQSFDWEYLRAFHEQEPKQVLGALGPPSRMAAGRKRPRIRQRLSAAWLDELGKSGAKVVVWNKQVSRQAIHLAHQRGLKVWIYTINSSGLAKRLLGLGVDGLITNNVRLIQRAVASFHPPGRFPAPVM